MNPILIAGLLGAGAGFLSRDKKKSRKKMARGGQVPDHLIDVLTNQTTLRRSAVQELVEDNHFSKDDVVSIISGIGRRQIDSSDVEIAAFNGVGSRENEELVEFAKSGKAFDFARGGRLDEEAIKYKLDDIGVEYERFLEEGADLDEIQHPHLGFIYDSDTNTWSSFKGGRNIFELYRSYNAYKTPVSQKVKDSAKEFAYLLDSVLRALSLPHVKTYGWNGSSFDAVGSYDFYINKGDDFDERTRDLIRDDYHDNVEEVLKFVCEMTGAVLDEYDREAPNITGSVAVVDIDAMVEAQDNRRAELRKKFGFAHGGKTHSLKFQKVDFPFLQREGIQRHKAQGDEYIFVIDQYVTSDSKKEYGDGEFGGNVHLYVRDKDGKEVDFIRFLDDYDDAVAFANRQNSGVIGIGTMARYAKGGQIASAIFSPNSKKGKIATSFGDKTKEGLTAMIENDSYSPKEIANAIFESNEKRDKVKTNYGDKTKEGLIAMIESARDSFAKGGKTDKALERTLSRFRAIREGSERRDAQARQRRRLRQHQTGMSAGAFAKGGVTGSYWEDKGKYQKEYEKAYDMLVPLQGEADAGLPEALRAISRIAYDYYNNGFANLWDCYEDGYYEEYDDGDEWIETEECQINSSYETFIYEVGKEIPYDMSRELDEFIEETEGGRESNKDVILDRILDHIMEKIKDSGLIDDDNFAKGGKVKGLDKYGSWYYMDDDGTLFVRYQEVGEDKAPKWDEDDDEWGVVEERAFGTMERQEFEKDMKKLFGRKPKLG